MEAVKWLAALIAATVVLSTLVGIGALIVTAAIVGGAIVGCGAVILGLARMIRGS